MNNPCIGTNENDNTQPRQIYVMGVHSKLATWNLPIITIVVEAKESRVMMLWAVDNQPYAWSSSAYSFYITEILFVFLLLCFVIAFCVVII